MSVKVITPSGDEDTHEAGRDASVIKGHLHVWDGTAFGKKPVAIYAPGQWESTVIDSSAN